MLNRKAFGRTLCHSALGGLMLSFWGSTSASPANGTTVTYAQVAVLPGRFVLIRNDKSACAIRFISFTPKLPGSSSSTDLAVSTDYEWYLVPDVGTSTKFLDAESGKSEAINKPLRGIGRIAFKVADSEVRCGPFTLPWMYPTYIAFSRKVAQDDSRRVEIAPTCWMAANEIDLASSRLVWYQFDKDRAEKNITDEELCAASRVPLKPE